jgi:hypothetical protein
MHMDCTLRMRSCAHAILCAFMHKIACTYAHVILCAFMHLCACNSSGFEDESIGRGRGAEGQGRYSKPQGRRDLGRDSDARWEEAGWGRGTEMDMGPDNGGRQPFGLFTQDAFEYVDPDPFAEDGGRDFDFFAPPTRVNAREEAMRNAGLGDLRGGPMGQSGGERGQRSAAQSRRVMQPDRLADMKQPGMYVCFLGHTSVFLDRLV